ncbi:hypothetical protein [Paenibacillus sp. RC67]|uniref:hypothetical protein n=1 Tax=Paenibacillus sp. RC67 TaxID=3039392 RepID=UPI0024AE5990|nr:hypothetical protein [Paenibacillus sp. RC67]
MAMAAIILTNFRADQGPDSASSLNTVLYEVGGLFDYLFPVKPHLSIQPGGTKNSIIKKCHDIRGTKVKNL